MIGEALQRSAASFNAANTDLSEAIALVTATNTVVQDPSSVGTLWKTLSARIRGATTELAELEEEEDEFTKTTSKLQDLVKGLTGFDILEEDGETFKSIYDIILGIGKEWQNLSDIEQASLGEALAGKRNANALYSVLNNIETLEAAYATAEDSANSAQEEQENYAKSIQYSLDVLSATAQEFWSALINSQVAKNIIDFLTKLLDILTQITEATNGVPIFAGVGLLAMFGKNPRGFLKTIEKIAENFGIIESAAYKSGKAVYGVAEAISSVSKAMTMLKIAGIVGAITVAVVAAKVAWDHYNTTVQEVDENISDISGTISDLNDEIKELEDIEDRTSAQETRLGYLKDELEIQKELLEIAERKKALESVTSENDSFVKQFTDWYDEDNYSTQLRKSQEKFYYTSRYDTRLNENESERNKLIEDQKKYNAELANTTEETKEWEQASTKLTETTNKLEQVESDIKGDYGEVYTEYATVYGNYQELLSMMETYKDDSILYERLKNEVDEYEEYLEVLRQNLIRAREILGQDTSDLTLDDRFSEANSKIASTQEDIDKLTEYTKDFSNEQKEAWIAATQGAHNANEAIQMYEDSLEKATNSAKELAGFDFTKFNEQDDDLENLQSLYNSFRENVEGDTITVPLDISDVEGLREKWESIVGKEAFDEFEIKITTDNTSVADVQKAFDSIVTSYARNMIKIQGATKETMEVIKSQMKLDGLESEGVDQFVDSIVAEDKMQAFVSTLEKAQDAEGEMADGAVDAASDIYEEAKALGIADEMLIDYLKQAALAGNIVLSGDTSWLDLLAEKLGMDIDLLKELLGLANQGSGIVVDNNGKKHSTYGMPDDWQSQQQKWHNNEKYRNVGYTPSKTEASKAGSDAADAYVEAYNKEKSALERDRDMGLISEKEYLEKLKALIDKFFKDRAEYAENYMDEMKSYMDALLSHYNSVISGVTTLLDRRISSLEKQKESAVSALEAEQEAAEAAYQAEIDALQEEIDAIDEKIDAIDDEIDGLNDEIDKYNDMIDAINEANDAREREINLSKALYELQRAQNQRTKLVYTGEKGQMRYERDASAVRDAQEQVKDAQDEIAIAAIEKQISLLEDEIELLEGQKEALQDQQEALQKQQEQIQKAMEASSKYYENLIKETENYWDSMIEALENTKSKWEELAETESVAKAWGLVADEMAKFGYTVEDVLNDTPGAFDSFKNAYLGVLTDMHSGDQGFLDGLKATTGQIPEQYDKISQAATEAKTPINELGTTVGTATGKVSSLGTTASTAAAGVGQLKTASEGISENLDKLESVDLTAFESKLGDITQDIQEIIDKIGASGTTGTLVGAFESLNNLNFDTFTQALSSLQSTISSVVGQLDGSAASGDLTSTGSQSNSMSADTGSNATGGGSLVDALDAVQQKATETIGVGGGSGATTEDEGTSTESDGTVIGDFNALGGSIQNATTAIGTSESEADSADLIGSITALGEKDTEILRGGDNGGSGVIQDWTDFNEQLNDAEDHITKMVDGLNNLKDSYETTLTVTLEIEGGGMYTGTATVSGGKGSFNVDVLDALGLPNESGTWNSDIKHHAKGTAKIKGPANFNGNWGYEGGKTMIAELGPELVVYPDGHFETFDKPQIVDLPRNSVIFNHLQTGEILDGKNQIRSGKSNAQGTLPSGFSALPFDSSFAKLQARIKEMGMPTIDGIKSVLQAQTDAIRTDLQNVAGNVSSATTVNQHNTFNISGVTGEDVARQINTTLVNTFQGMSLNAYQRSMA